MPCGGELCVVEGCHGGSPSSGGLVFPIPASVVSLLWDA